MPKLLNRPPRLCHEKRRSQAVVRIGGKKIYLGAWGTEESKQRYKEHVDLWRSGLNEQPAEPPPITINELLLAFWDHAEVYYRKPDGSPSSELRNLNYALTLLADLKGLSRVTTFGPRALKEVRDAMIKDGHCRLRINKDIGRIKLVFRWGVEEELVPGEVYSQLKAVAGLKAGRSKAKESDPVEPVDEKHVLALLPYVRPQVAAMIQLQNLTGMRSGELTIIRGCDIDMSGEVWWFRPASHKTQHHGHDRLIAIGPQAQSILKPWLKLDLQAYLFSPRESREAWYAEKRAARKSKVTPSQSARKRKGRPKRAPGEHYTPASYHGAIEQGIVRANKLIADPAKKIPHWFPHQLRHAAATRLERLYDIDAARLILGHRSAAVTQVYVKLDRARAGQIMSKVG